MSPMLNFQLALPNHPADGAPLVILLHGRGSDENDLLGLRDELPEPCILVTPRAPFDAAPWGYGPGYAWYRFIGGTTPEPESFTIGQQHLGEFLAALPAKLPVKPGPLVLGGFSQGGTAALGFALGHPGTVPTVVNLSGFLPAHPAVVVTPATVAGTRIFWGHGLLDQSIPFAAAEAGWAALEAAGADLTSKSYRTGHTISAEEMADLQKWLG